jgi:hypothetical protein
MGFPLTQLYNILSRNPDCPRIALQFSQTLHFVHAPDKAASL